MSGSRREAPRITVYTTPACHWCTVAKRYLAEKGFEFTEIDVTRDRRGLKRMVLMTGQRGVPVIQVGDRAMAGWDKREFERLLKGGGRR